MSLKQSNIRLDDILPDIYFDVRSRRFRYRDSKAFASIEAVQHQAEKYRNNQQTALAQLAQKYAQGTINLKQLQEESAISLKRIHLAEMLRAISKQEQVTAERFLIVGRNLKQQYYTGKDPMTGERYGLKYLFRDLVEGKVSPGQLENRLRMFGESGKLTYWSIRANTASDIFTEARRILGAAEHCPNCVEYARRGWVAIAEVIYPTQACQCRTNCKCSLEFR